MSTVVSNPEVQPVKIRQLLKKYHSDSEGLTDQQAEKYQKEQGFNEIVEKRMWH